MSLKNLKLEFFYWRKAFFEYRQGFKYLYNKYFLAPKILRANKIFEKPINNPNLSIHILTCHKDLIICLWSLASFYQVATEIGQLYIHNDGTLTIKDGNILKKIFPSARIIEPQSINQENNLFQQYPWLKKFRFEIPNYFLIKKLIDPYLISDKKNILIIDSDLLWFKEPTKINEEIKDNCLNSLMVANNSLSFVYFKNNEKLDEQSASFNSGIVLYQPDHFNRQKLNSYLEKIDIANQQNRHFIEQAGYAFCLENLKKLNEKKYTIKEKVGEETVVKHYTSPRRPLFYLEGLKIIKNRIYE